MKLKTILYIGIVLWLSACTAEETSNTRVSPDAIELSGIQAVVEGGTAVPSRAGTVTRLANYVGRNKFITDDKIIFTNISRTVNALNNFTYPGNGGYEGITFQAGQESAWSRVVSDEAKEPERVYWTDAESDHTFVAYSIPQTASYDWKQYKHTSGSEKTWYLGSLGDPTTDGIIDFNPSYSSTDADADEKAKDSTALANEDLLIAYDTKMQAEPGGSVALVKFYHALSSVRVVVNISGFASTSSAADVKTTVSDMLLLHQPTMYMWKQTSAGAQPVNAEDATTTAQEIVNMAWTGNSTGAPKYDQRKDLKLWIPNPKGSGTNQSKTFTFYGITTPQDASYVNTLSDATHKKVELQFTVTYPNPLKPTTEILTKKYKASLDDVFFEPGYNTTINISLNHKDEQMTVGAEYENWIYAATPDVGQLRKNSTFLQDADVANVTIHDEKGADDKDIIADDATWLYQLDDPNDKSKKIIYDIYGHQGDSETDAYQISTAYQLLSFAKEVKSGMTFEGKYVRLDADLTLQPSTKETQPEVVPNEKGEIATADAPLEWVGIGNETYAFNGTFLGGNRFIYRLYGKPLFINLGAKARIEQLQVQALTVGNGTYTVVQGNGLFADTNNGRISGSKVVGNVSLSGSKVVGNVSLSGSTVGAFVGENTSTGVLFACYHIGDTKGPQTVGGLVGTNTGTINSCFQAGAVVGDTKWGIAVNSSTTAISNTYFNTDLFTYTGISTGVTGKTTAEMTKKAFVDECLNPGITTFREAHKTGDVYEYKDYSYVYNAANYPTIKYVDKTATPSGGGSSGGDSSGN